MRSGKESKSNKPLHKPSRIRVSADEKITIVVGPDGQGAGLINGTELGCYVFPQSAESYLRKIAEARSLRVDTFVDKDQTTYLLFPLAHKVPAENYIAACRELAANPDVGYNHMVKKGCPLAATISAKYGIDLAEFPGEHFSLSKTLLDGLEYTYMRSNSNRGLC